MAKTKIVQPVDMDQHIELRKRVAFLEAMFCEAIAAIASTHHDEEFLMSIVNQVLPEETSHDAG